MKNKFGSEAGKARAWRDAFLRAITTGEPKKARFIRQDEFEMVRQAQRTEALQ